MIVIALALATLSFTVISALFLVNPKNAIDDFPLFKIGMPRILGLAQGEGVMIINLSIGTYSDK